MATDDRDGDHKPGSTPTVETADREPAPASTDTARAGLEALRAAVAEAIEARADAKRRRAAIFEDVETFGDLAERVGPRCAPTRDVGGGLDIFAIYDGVGAEREAARRARRPSRTDAPIGDAEKRRRESLDRDLLDLNARVDPERRARRASAPAPWRRMLRELRDILDAEAAEAGDGA